MATSSGVSIIGLPSRAGIPRDLYHTTLDPDSGVPFDEDDGSPQQQLLRDMFDSLNSTDIESLLPQQTEA